MCKNAEMQNNEANETIKLIVKFWGGFDSKLRAICSPHWWTFNWMNMYVGEEDQYVIRIGMTILKGSEKIYLAVK